MTYIVYKSIDLPQSCVLVVTSVGLYGPVEVEAIKWGDRPMAKRRRIECGAEFLIFRCNVEMACFGGFWGISGGNEIDTFEK